MANLSKLKRPNSLGAPPPLDEASQNLKAPEIAPHASPPPIDSIIGPERKQNDTPGRRLERASEQYARVDGRSLRKSGRLIPFATRVSPEFDERLRNIAQRDGLLLVEVLEHGLDAYEAARR
jgi:hypothetical protein